MKVNKSSWHYRVFDWWVNTSEAKRARKYQDREVFKYYEEGDERDPDGWTSGRYVHVSGDPVSLCPYFWIVVLRAPLYWLFNTKPGIILFGLIAFFTAWTAVTFVGGNAWWVFPAWAFGLAAATAVVVALSGLIAVGWDKFKDWNDKRKHSKPKVEKEPSLVTEFVKAKKSKVCPILEFEEDNV